MSDLSPGLIQRHRQWQADSIFEQKRHKGTPKRELRGLREQITERQRELVRYVDSGTSALTDYMQDKLRITDDLLSVVPSLSRKMTLDEFRDPTFEIELALAKSMVGQITRAQARQPAFWFVSILEWIRSDMLPANLSEALLVGQSRATQQELLEHQTRNFIRRTGGIDVVRGNISVLSDCSVSRAWWRRTIAEDAAQASNGEIDVDSAHRILHAHNDEWEGFALDALRRLPVTSHPHLRAAVLCAFPDAKRGDGAAKRPKLQATARNLGRLGPTASMRHIPWSELRDLAATAARSV